MSWKPKGEIENIAYAFGARGYCARCGCHYSSKKEHLNSPEGKIRHPNGKLR